MNKRYFARTIALSGLALLAVGCFEPAQAQLNQGGQQGIRRPPPMRRPKPKNYILELKDVAEALGKKFEARIVVDPLVFVAAKPSTPAATELPKALDELVTGLKMASWRRVYLPQSQGNGAIVPEKLAATVRALELVEHSGLVLENTAARKATMLQKNFNVPPDFNDALAAQQFDTRAVYVLYNANPNADADKSPEDKMFDLQKAQMDLMMQMDPDSLAQSMAKGMQLWNNMDPATRTTMMGTMMKAGMQMFNNMSAADRQGLMQMMMQNAQGLLGGGGGRPNP